MREVVATILATAVWAATADALKGLILLEARVGIEPTHKGFADLSLTTWVPRHPGCPSCGLDSTFPERSSGKGIKLERETGFEPATSSLARKHSTTELLPLNKSKYIDR